MGFSRGSLIPLTRPFPAIPGSGRRPLETLAFCSLLSGLAAVLLISGCTGKTPSKIERRAVTQEIISSARKILGPQSEITIRPQMQRSPTGATTYAADEIELSPADTAQARRLENALGQIAQRHKLDVARSSSAGGVELDFSSHGVRTHSIRMATPAASRAATTTANSGRGPRLAIILDDLGHDRSSADSVLALPFPVTVSVIPHLPLSSQVADEAFRRGDQVLLHLPMQSELAGVKQEDIELRVGMNSRQVESILAGMLATVPHAVGVNNHEGSAATADPVLMGELMPDLQRRGLFFIDSRTTAATVAYQAAEQAGVRAASRKVFLDDTPTKEAVGEQLQLAARDASRNGFAIAIGHPHSATIAALAEIVPQLQARGLRLVFASDLVR